MQDNNDCLSNFAESKSDFRNKNNAMSENKGVETSEKSWSIFHNSINTIVNILIGANVFVALWFASSLTSKSPFQLHIGLSVIGYQFLMSHAILSLNEHNRWSKRLPNLYRLRAHVVLQVLGSITAIAGSIIMMREKESHFTSAHGKFALAAFIFTCISLINGTISFFSIGRPDSVKIAKINHVVCGAASYTLSSACLSFGYFKSSFKDWSSNELALVMVCVTCVYTSLLILRPCNTFIKKILTRNKKKES